MRGVVNHFDEWLRRRITLAGGVEALLRLGAVAEGEGIYASYRLHPFTVGAIQEWAETHGLLDRMIDPEELHLTTVYSRRPFPMEAVGKRPLRVKFVGFELFGKDEKDMLVALVESEELQDLFAARLADGMETDFPKYRPHISLIKGMTDGEVENLPPFDFPIRLTEEEAKPLNEDFSYDDKIKTTAADGDPEGQMTLGPIKYDQRKGLGNVPDNQEVGYKGFAVLMKPSQFAKLAVGRDFSAESNLAGIKKLLADGKPLASPFLDVWFDRKGKEPPEVRSHEGRTRMEAIRSMHGDVPVLVHVFISGGLRAKNITAEQIAAFRASARPEKPRESKVKKKVIPGPHFDSKVWHLNTWINASQPPAEKATARLAHYMTTASTMREGTPILTNDAYRLVSDDELMSALPKAQSYYAKHDMTREARRRGLLENPVDKNWLLTQARKSPEPHSIDQLADSTLRGYLSWRANSGKARPRYSRPEIVKELQRRGLHLPNNARRKKRKSR